MRGSQRSRIAWRFSGNTAQRRELQKLSTPTVRFNFNDCHRDSCCRRKTLRFVGTSSRIRALRRNLREQRLRRAQRCGEAATLGSPTLMGARKTPKENQNENTDNNTSGVPMCTNNILATSS